jgi:hypothetical protein
MKRLFTQSILLGLLLFSCQQQEIDSPKLLKKGIVKTSVDNDPLALSLIDQVFKNYSAPKKNFNQREGELSESTTFGTIFTDSLFKYVDDENDILNYTFLLADDSPFYFENLVISKLDGWYYGFIHRFIPDETNKNGEPFRGLIQRYNLKRELIGEFKLPFSKQADGNGGRVELVSYCVKSIEIKCTTQYEVSTATGLVLPGTLSTVCTTDFVYGWCDDGNNTPGGGGFSYGYYGSPVVTTNGSNDLSASTKGGVSSSTGSVPNPIVVVEEDSNWTAFQEQLLQNPALLLEIPCAQLQKWQTLTQHRPSQSVLDKLQAIKNNYSIGDVALQSIQNASGEIVNLDYFPVKITTLPNNPLTGQRFTAPAFLNYIRTHMNDFVDTSITGFSPSMITGFNETQIWNSSNPLGGVIHLNIALPGGDGSVICSLYNPNNWIFSTIELPYNPFSQQYDGQHPVSGNREFGFIQNADASYTFYTRGVDRITDALEALVAENLVNEPFKNPDALWNSFKAGIYNFTQANSGSAIPPSTRQNAVYRPDWVKVREVLMGQRPTSDLGCN